MNSNKLANSKIVAKVKKLLGADRVISHPTELLLYDCDGLRLHRSKPAGVAIVENKNELQKLIQLFHKHKQSFVARGAGTGLSGGAIALEDSWLVDLNRMRKLIEINVEDRYAVVEPGLVNLDLDYKLLPHNLRFAPDPSSQKACTLGGNAAENAGGPHCFLHGMTSAHILELEWISASGEIERFGHRSGYAAGPDWRGLMIGSEGTLGVISELVLGLIPRASSVRTWLAAFDSLSKACDTVSSIIAQGLRPAALEILDRLTIQAVEASKYRAGYPQNAAAVLLIEQEGEEEAIEQEAFFIKKLCRQHDALSLEEARDEEERKRLWKGRKGAFGAMGRVDTDLYVLDGVVPRQKLAQVIEKIQRLGTEYDLVLSNVFHAGDGNLHPNISFNASNPDQCKRVIAAGEAIIEICLEAGGTLSGEHGIGLEKKKYMSWLFNEADLHTQETIKDIFDPDGLANPGKIFPSTRSCTESGFRNQADLKRMEEVLDEPDPPHDY